jgi:Tfp pilus assembly protein PilV
MIRRRLAAADDRGESLIEVLVSIVILGVCVVAIGSGVALSVKMSAIHRNQAVAAAFLHNYAETVQSGYAGCTSSTTPNYASGLATPTTGGTWTVSQTSIKYWDSSALVFSASCPAAGDPGLQQVTLNLANANGLVSESLVVTVRKP